MKKLVIVLGIILLLFPISAYADRVTLNSSETLSTPVATHLDWYVDKIDAKSKELIVRYRWLDASGTPIMLSGSRTQWHTWSCRDIPDDPETPGDESTTDFTDIFGFSIRQQDVGVSIGVGLRTLIWSKMKGDILTVGNDGTFGQ